MVTNEAMCLLAVIVALAAESSALALFLYCDHYEVMSRLWSLRYYPKNYSKAYTTLAATSEGCTGETCCTTC